jgi:pimeloyl-ACP methyl ester carboxylesterase
MQSAARREKHQALLFSAPNPARDYDEALKRFAAMQALDGPAVNRVCRSALLTHDAPTEQVIALVHGITNCPRQFVQLAPLFFERGYNVLIPRIPWNGFADRSGVAMERLTARELRDFGNEIVDTARGLGEHVTVLGLSGGGVVAAWIAQCRADVEQVIVIAPCIGIVANAPLGRTGNVATNRFATWLMGALPNMMTQTFRPMKGGPPHNYQGFATRGLGQTTELGLAIYDAARTQSPAARTIAMITNDRDIAVNNVLARDLARRWQARAPGRVTNYVFRDANMLDHDIIDPTQKSQRVEYVYPILLDLCGARREDEGTLRRAERQG